MGGENDAGPWFDFSDDYFAGLHDGTLPPDVATSNEVEKAAVSITSHEELNATLAILYTSYCQRLKVDKIWRRQFLVLFLSALYWPMYTRTKHWNPPMTSNFFKVVLAKSIALSDLGNSNPRISRFVKRATQCGFQGIIEEGLPRLTEVTDYESFSSFVRKEKQEDHHLAVMLRFIPDLKWSLDESSTTIGYVYHQVSELHVLYSYSNVLTTPSWISMWERSFRHEQRAATTAVMLLGLSNTQVTDRPMGGILILKLSRLVVEDLLILLRNKREDDPSLQEQLDKFEVALKRSILESVRQVLLRMALLVESNWLCSQQILQARFPDVLVTAYRARGSGGPTAAVERGEFGSEISEGFVTVLNQNLNENEMYVQLSVADPINAQQKGDTTFISALKAASMFKQRLEDDPSLPGVGLAEVVYSTFNDLQYAEIAVGGNSRYDPDLHLLLQVPSDLFKDSASFHELFMGAILVQPLTYATPRHVRMDRVHVMGYAMKAGSARPIRMGKFGSGLAYSEQPLIDQLIQRHGFVVHVLVNGLRNDISRKESEATAEEIYKRFKSRTRGTFNVIFLEPVKLPETRISGDFSHRQEGYPGWVIGVAVGSVTIFFLGLLGCLVLRKHVSMPWWIDCLCSPSPPSFQSKQGVAEEGDVSRSSSFRPSIGTGESPFFESDDAKPSKRMGLPVRGAAADVNIGWESGTLSTLEMAKTRRMESKRQGKVAVKAMQNAIPELISEAKIPNRADISRYRAELPAQRKWKRDCNRTKEVELSCAMIL
ncbi:uncharacterized protein LOC34618607 [Cyclospora cayetanensis]|uniref:Uncharacterized protein LOC34618607 n=1 Tax=Cyclospora cayetanensis TaxID=88456 RepID=A0A6P6RQ94_9EIME|nr:uncharacterized protein LOC34618607 [Cyclospora cayetanensis]